MAPRVTYRKRNSYNTRSNGIRKVKTPGGRVVVQYPNKTAGAVRCAEVAEKLNIQPSCRVALNGIPRIRPHKFRQLKKRERTVSRPYGGSLCHKCLRERIVRAFLVEEVKIVKKIMTNA